MSRVDKLDSKSYGTILLRQNCIGFIEFMVHLICFVHKISKSISGQISELMYTSMTISYRSFLIMVLYFSLIPSAMSNYALVPSCIPLDSNVTVEFFIDRPKTKDFVAIFSMDSVNNSNSNFMEGENLCVKEWMPSPLHRNWIRTCGSQTCHYSTKEEIPSQGMVQIDFTQSDGSKQWIAVVARPGKDEDQPLTILATSQEFSSCTPPVRC